MKRALSSGVLVRNLMHCELGHTFSHSQSYRDAHGTWCPECGNSAHSGQITACSTSNGLGMCSHHSFHPVEGKAGRDGMCVCGVHQEEH